MALPKAWQVLVFFVSLFPGVMCADTYSVAGLVASAAVAFVFLVVVIVMVVIGFTWNSWFPALQRGRGRVKMPREYWKKKEEARLRLISGSRSLAASEAGLPNGGTINRVQDTDDRSDGASWIQGWNNAHPPPPSSRSDKAYEEKDLTMELGEEDDFRIETTIVDNETLDLGPFHDDTPRQRQQEPPPEASEVPRSTEVATMQLEDEEETGLYSVVDKSRMSSTRSNDALPADYTDAVTSFSKLGPELVAL